MAENVKPPEPRSIRKLPYYVIDRVSKSSTGTKIAIGAGAVAVAGIVGYGLYSAVTSSGTDCSSSSSPCGQAVSTCNKALQAAAQNYAKYSMEFIQEDAALGVPMTSAQLSYLQTFTNEENTAAQCIATITKANSQNPLDIISSYVGKAILVALTLYVGVRGAAYIISKYFNNKSPPKPPSTGSGGSGTLYGLIDYLKATGQIPVTWNASGTTTVDSTIPVFNEVSQELVVSLENASIITEVAGATLLAAESALITEQASILLVALA